MAGPLLNLHVANTLPSGIPESTLTKSRFYSCYPAPFRAALLGPPAPPFCLSLPPAPSGVVRLLHPSCPPPPSSVLPGNPKSPACLPAQPLATGDFYFPITASWGQGPSPQMCGSRVI